jgi:cytochrome c biogenesis protein CcmG, thiol:disulfide interchange protein DsbE
VKPTLLLDPSVGSGRLGGRGEGSVGVTDSHPPVPEPPLGASDEPTAGGTAARSHGQRSRSRRWITLVASAAALCLVVGGVVAALGVSDNPPPDELTGRTGQPAPQFSLPELEVPSHTVSLSQFEGKDLVLNFWASWCYPCQQEMPVLQRAFDNLHGKVRFVGIDTNDTHGAAIGFLQHVRVAYPTLFDPDAKVAGQYGLFGLPTTVFVSAAGREIGRHSGQLDTTTLQAALHQAFGARVTF